MNAGQVDLLEALKPAADVASTACPAVHGAGIVVQVLGLADARALELVQELAVKVTAAGGSALILGRR